MTKWSWHCTIHPPAQRWGRSLSRGGRLAKTILYAACVMMLFVGVTEVNASVPSPSPSKHGVDAPPALQVMGQWGSFDPSGEGQGAQTSLLSWAGTQDSTEFLDADTPALSQPRPADIEVALARIQYHLNRGAWLQGAQEAQALAPFDGSHRASRLRLKACLILEDGPCIRDVEGALYRANPPGWVMEMTAFLIAQKRPKAAESLLLRAQKQAPSPAIEGALAQLYGAQRQPTLDLRLRLAWDTNLTNLSEGDESQGLCHLLTDCQGLLNTGVLAHRTLYLQRGGQLMAQYGGVNRQPLNQAYADFHQLSHGGSLGWHSGLFAFKLLASQVKMGEGLGENLLTQGQLAASAHRPRPNRHLSLTYGLGLEAYGTVLEGGDERLSFYYAPGARRRVQRLVVNSSHRGAAWAYDLRFNGRLDRDLEGPFKAQEVGGQFRLSHGLLGGMAYGGLSAMGRQAHSGREELSGGSLTLNGGLTHALGHGFALGLHGEVRRGRLHLGDGAEGLAYAKDQLFVELQYAWR